MSIDRTWNKILLASLIVSFILGLALTALIETRSTNLFELSLREPTTEDRMVCANPGILSRGIESFLMTNIRIECSIIKILQTLLKAESLSVRSGIFVRFFVDQYSKLNADSTFLVEATELAQIDKTITKIRALVTDKIQLQIKEFNFECQKQSNSKNNKTRQRECIESQVFLSHLKGIVETDFQNIAIKKIGSQFRGRPSSLWIQAVWVMLVLLNGLLVCLRVFKIF